MIISQSVAEKNAAFRVYNIPEVKVSKVCEQEASSGDLLNRADLVNTFFHETIAKSSWFDPEKEAFVVCLLNRKNRCKAFNLVSIGSQSATMAHSREVYRAAIVGSAAAVICIHNHPSGDPAPSAADLQITRQLRESSKVVDIILLDHVIIGSRAGDPSGRGFYSFREAGLL